MILFSTIISFLSYALFSYFSYYFEFLSTYCRFDLNISFTADREHLFGFSRQMCFDFSLVFEFISRKAFFILRHYYIFSISAMIFHIIYSFAIYIFTYIYLVALRFSLLFILAY